MGFICCVVVSELQSNKRYKLLGWAYSVIDDQTLENYEDTIVEEVNGSTFDLEYKKDAMKLISDHMLLRYEICNCHFKIEGNESKTNEMNFLIKFKILTDIGESDIVIKECGVQPLYASKFFESTEKLKTEEYLNSKLNPESWESINETEAGRSNEKKLQKLPPIQKTFLPIPMGIPEEGTSGLKEVFKF